MTDNTQYQDEEGELDVPEQPLEQDYDTPAAPPDEDPSQSTPIDHPNKDTDVDAHDAYDETETGASNTFEQHEEQQDPEERIG